MSAGVGAPSRHRLDGRRVASGYLLALLLPTVAAVVLVPLRGTVNLVSDMLLLVLTTVVAALVGGLGPALLSAIIGSTVLNYFFTPPLRTLSIEDPNNALALVVFVVVAMLVSWAVEVAARRTHEAARAASESDALVDLDRTRPALLAAVGHHLRTPLAAAKASLSTLRSQDLTLTDHDRDELVATAEESLDRLTALIENLLDMSWLQAGAMAVVLRPVGLEDVLPRVVDDLGDEAVLVELDLPARLPEVDADAGLLERVLANLLANAVRYSPAGRPPSLRAGQAGQLVEVLVIDHGPGIPQDRRDQVFLPFQRLGDIDNTTGVGLGLALSRGPTEAMGGMLEAEENPGGGLTMKVQLRATTPADGCTPARPQPGLRERAQSTPAAQEP